MSALNQTPAASSAYRRAPPLSPPRTVTFLEIVVLLGLAVFAHVAFQDFYLLGAGQTRVYVTAQELLLTAFFAVMLARHAVRVARDQRSMQGSAAITLLFLVTVGCAYWAIKIVLYPFEADTIEGNILLQGVNFHDSPALLYPDPEHYRAISYRYTPLSGLLYGTIYLLTGRTLFYARLLNFGVILATGILLTRLIGMSRMRAFLVFSCWLCVQIFLCSYLFSLRPDALLVFLLALSCWLFRRYLEDSKQLWILALCGTVLFLGVLTKQHAVFVLAAFVSTLAWKRQYRAVLLLTGIVVVLLIPVTIWLNQVTGGWYIRTASLGRHQKLYLVTFSLLAANAIPVFILGCGIRAGWIASRVKPLFRHPDAWLYWVAACYFPIATLALLEGRAGSMNNFAFEFAILLPAACAVIAGTRWGLLASSVLLAVTLPYYVNLQPFADWMVYAPAQAREAVSQIEAATGPVLLSRRQEFLFRTGRPVFDDLGVMFYEFDLSGYPQTGARINREIRSGKYQLIMLEPGELTFLEDATRTYLSSHYDLSDDPKRALFEDRLTKRAGGRP